MKIEILSFSQEDCNRDWLDSYLKKSSQFVKTERHVLKTKKSSARTFKKDSESQTFLEYIKPDDFVVICDEGGKGLDSRAFAKELNRWLGSSKKRILLAIGGAFGWNDDVKSRSDMKICLAPFTLNHVVAEWVLVEQVFRSLCILNNHPYHND